MKNTILTVAMATLFIGCVETERVPVSKGESETQISKLSQTPQLVAAETIPSDVSYKIIDHNISGTAKRSLDIRINRKVSEGVLAAIAEKLKNAESHSFNRTFIGYYLPDMKVNQGYWATTHYNPHLKVQILGLTEMQEKNLGEAEEIDPSRLLIGRWLNANSFSGSRITIFEKDGVTYMENKYKDGSAGVTEITETASPLGRRFDYKPDRGNGEYCLIDATGNLKQLDGDGPFMTAKAIK
ncbi:hypothetical protein N9Y42_05915 [Mariniblastus sp.]|nr:hypothetical protein [Mariniblastus sp.]